MSVVRSHPVELMKEIDWQLRSKCWGLNPDVFFPVVSGGKRVDGVGSLDWEQAQIASSICHGIQDNNPCPVRVECLEYAIANSEDYGVWGGTTEKERVKIRRSRIKRQVA
jgi:WhiB family redox-sensing transcriptional regulator